MNGKANDQLGNANTQRGKTPKTTTTPDAKSGENGGTKVTVAGAVAINCDRHRVARFDRRRRLGDVDGCGERARPGEHGRVGEGGRQGGRGRRVRRWASAPRWRSTWCTIVDEALHRHDASSTRTGLTLAATMRDVSRRSEARAAADATSGAGGGKVSIAGSLALTIADVKTTAQLKSNTSRTC